MPSRLFKRSFKVGLIEADVIARAVDLASEHLHDWIYQKLSDDLLNFSIEAEVHTTDSTITVILVLSLEISPLSPKVREESHFLEAAANEFFRSFKEIIKNNARTAP